jgi:Tol biopolymer transport system component
MAQPLDPRSFELGGEPFPVVEQVGSSQAMGLFAVSANGALAFRSSSPELHLVWLDREGKILGTLGPGGTYLAAALSPDGKRVAVDSRDQQGTDVWLLDVSSGVPTRFTFYRHNEAPVWSPNGARIAFGNGSGDIYQKESMSAGNQQLLLKSGLPQLPQSWSPDGKYLLYFTLDKNTKEDLWILPMATPHAYDNKPTPYLKTPFSEFHGQFSPDGRWVAYTSDESGQFQVYVQSFPIGAGKFQVSTNGGTQPRWRRDGKEIFYIGGDGKLMAAELTTGPRFEVTGAPKALFDPYIPRGSVSGFRYDVTADGKRFLVISAASADEAAAPITVVLNWQAALKR